MSRGERLKLKVRLIVNDFIYAGIDAIAVFTVLFLLTRTYIGLSLAIVFAILMFILYLSLSGHKLVVRTSAKHASLSKTLHVLTLVLFIFSFLTVIFIPSLSDLIFINWISIPVPNWIRFITGISLVTLWPGYFMLKLLDRRDSRIKSALDRLVLSYVVSVFLSIILGIINVYCKRYFSASFAEKQVLGLDALLFTAFLASNFKHVMNKQSKHVRTDFKMDSSHIILILLSVFFLLSYFFIYSSLGNINMMIGDLMNHHGATLDILAGRVVDRVAAYYPYFHMYLANLMITAGLPSANAATLSGFLNLFYILAFYVMARAVTGENSGMPALSTVIFTIFNGFEWIYVWYLRLYGDFPNLYDLLRYVSTKTWYGVMYSSFRQIYYHAPHTLGFISLFASVYIVKKIIDGKKHERYFNLLLFIAISTGIFCHLVEAYVLAVFLIALMLITQKSEQRRISLILLTYTISFLLVITADSLLLAKVTVRMEITYGLILGLALLMISFSKSKVHFSLRAIQDLICKFKRFKTLAVFLVLYLMGLSFIVWTTSPLSLSYLWEQGYGTIPWYYYPLKLGVVGFLALGSIAMINVSQRKETKFLVLSGILILALAKLLSLANTSLFWIGFREFRLVPHLLIPLSIMSAYCLSELTKWIRYPLLLSNRHYNYRKLVATSLLALVFIAGVCTTILQVQFWSNVITDPFPSSVLNVSPEDFEVLNFIKDHINGRILVLYTSSSAFVLSYKMYNLAGRVYGPRWALLEDWYGFNVSDMINPESTLYILRRYLNISYIAVLSKDLPRLNDLLPKNSIVHRLISYSPVVFNNSKLTIFELPYLVPPSVNASFLILYPNYIPFYSTISEKPLPIILGMIPHSGDDWTETNISAWSILGDAAVSISNNSFIGASSIRFSANLTKEFNVERYLPFINAEKYSLLQFYIKTNAPLSIRLRIGSDASNYFYRWLSFSPSSNFWKVVLKLGSDSEGWISHGKPNWHEVRWICFNVHPSIKNSEILIDGLSFAETYKFHNITYKEELIDFYVISMIAQSGADYSVLTGTDWNERIFNSNATLVIPYDPATADPLYTRLFSYIQGGGTVIIINTLGSGGFGELLSLAVDGVAYANKILFYGERISFPTISISRIVSMDPNTNLMAYYANDKEQVSGFLYQKGIGKGRVLYLNLFPFIQALENSSLNKVTKSILFGKLGSLFDIIQHTLNMKHMRGYGCNHVHNVVAEGDVSLSGLVTIHSPSITFIIGQPIHAEKIIITPQHPEISTLSDVYISSISVSQGSIDHLSISSNAIYLQPIALGSYSVLQVSSGNITINIGSGEVKLNITSNEQQSSLAIRNAKVTLHNVPSVIIITKTANIIVNGKVFLEKAWVSEHVVKDFTERRYSSIVFEGEISFEVSYSDNNRLFFSDFGYQGSHYYPTFKLHPQRPSLLYIEVTSISWKSVIASHYHIVLLLFLTSLVTLSRFITYAHQTRREDTLPKRTDKPRATTNTN